MTTTKVKIHTSMQPAHHYRLLHLLPELEEALANRDLVIKASGDHLVACTSTKTYNLRQTNQSNTILLVKPHTPGSQGVQPSFGGVARDEEERLLQEATGAVSSLYTEESTESNESNDSSIHGINGLLAFGNATNFVEPILIKKVQINWDLVPRYDPTASAVEQPTKTSFAMLRKQVSASDAEFDREWFFNGGFELQDQAWLPGNAMVSRVLTASMPYILTVPDWKSAPVDALFHSLQPYMSDIDAPYALVQGVLHKFASSDTDDYRTAALDHVKIAAHFGLETLKTYCVEAKATRLPFFTEKWARSIPISLDVELDLALLQGYYVCPTPTTIRYIEMQHLSSNPKLRFQQLFRLKASWEMSEILPFVEPVHLNKAIKLDNFIKKYAKQRRLGQRVVITAS